MKPIGVFYHCLLFMGSPDKPAPRGSAIIREQMACLKDSGLLDACDYFEVGINGGQESEVYVGELIPEKATRVYHGLHWRNELATIMRLCIWATNNPGASILYFHSKGATHPGLGYGEGMADPWRRAMMKYLVTNWRECVADLESGFDIAACHWMWNLADGTQHIPAGNFLWLTSDFTSKLPSFYLRDRIKVSGIANIESRYEAEVFWGNGPKPNVKSYLPNGGEGCP